MNQIILFPKYDWRLIVLAFGVILYTARMAFRFIGRITGRPGGAHELVLTGAGAVAMGLGIWSAHCIGMTALVLPVPIHYSIPLLLFSLGAAVASSAAALFAVSRRVVTESYLASAGIFLGIGVSTVHYLAMAAMQFAARQVYNFAFVALSVVVAIAGASAALRFAHMRDDDIDNPSSLGSPGVNPPVRAALTAGPNIRRPFDLRNWLKGNSRRWHGLGGAVVLSLTTAATCYTGMMAVQFHYNQSFAASNHAVSGPSLSVASVGLLTLFILALTLLVARVQPELTLGSSRLLREREMWLLVAAGSQDGLFEFDLTTGHAFYSARWKEIVGCRPDELASSQDIWRRSLHLADRESVESKLGQYLNGGQGAFEMEHRVLHADNSTRWVLARAQALWDEQGKPLRLVGSYTDITARKSNEEQLLLSESRYRGLFEANPMPSWIYSPNDLCIQDVNQAALDYFGWSRGQFVGKSINEIRMPGDENAAAPQRNIPWRLRRKNKSGIWVELTTYEIDGGELPARLMIANDVTSHVVKEAKIERARNQLETIVAQKNAELQTAEAQWHGLVENLGQMVWSIGADGACDYSNRKWTEVSGIPKEKLLGMGWLAAIHPDDRPRVESECLAAMQSPEPYTVRYRIGHRDGSYWSASAQFVPVRSAINEPISHWLGSATLAQNQALDEEEALIKV